MTSQSRTLRHLEVVPLVGGVKRNSAILCACLKKWQPNTLQLNDLWLSQEFVLSMPVTRLITTTHSDTWTSEEFHCPRWCGSVDCQTFFSSTARPIDLPRRFKNLATSRRCANIAPKTRADSGAPGKTDKEARAVGFRNRKSETGLGRLHLL